jgi:rhamnosyltransferase
MSVLAVIVTFNPKPEQLLGLIQAIEKSVNRILIIDNCSQTPLPTLIHSQKIDLIFNENNMGVGHAYNQAIARALNYEEEFIIFFDQDSEPDVYLIKHILGVYMEQITNGNKVAAIGPSYYENNSGHASVFKKRGWVRMVTIETNNTVIEVDHLISSGTMIYLNALKEIGIFEEHLFVDYVDTEWCIRAKNAGFQLLGCKSAIMNHTIGLSSINFFNRKTVVCEPIRVYYKARNAVWLARSQRISLNWRVILISLTIKLFVINVLLPSNKFTRIGFFIRGVFDGIANRMGKY